MTDDLSPMQVRILSAMRDDETGLAAFTGKKSRKLGFGISQALYGGIVIRAYQHPQWFLKNRRLIEKQDRDVQGTWYRLTDAGRAALQRLGK